MCRSLPSSVCLTSVYVLLCECVAAFSCVLSSPVTCHRGFTGDNGCLYPGKRFCRESKERMTCHHHSAESTQHSLLTASVCVCGCVFVCASPINLNKILLWGCSSLGGKLSQGSKTLLSTLFARISDFSNPPVMEFSDY